MNTISVHQYHAATCHFHAIDLRKLCRKMHERLACSFLSLHLSTRIASPCCIQKEVVSAQSNLMFLLFLYFEDSWSIRALHGSSRLTFGMVYIHIFDSLRVCDSCDHLPSSDHIGVCPGMPHLQGTAFLRSLPSAWDSTRSCCHILAEGTKKTKEIWEVGIKKMHLQSLYQAKRRASNVRMEDGQIRLGPARWSHEIDDVKSVQTQVPIWCWTTSIVKH